MLIWIGKQYSKIEQLKALSFRNEGELQDLYDECAIAKWLKSRTVGICAYESRILLSKWEKPAVS